MVVPALLALMDDFQSPRVQAHACAALVNFAGVVMGADMLAVLLALLLEFLLCAPRCVPPADDFPSAVVAAVAIAAVTEVCDKDTLQPYLDGVISKLLALLQRGRRNVQEGALTAVASVADTAEVGRWAGVWVGGWGRGRRAGG